MKWPRKLCLALKSSMAFRGLPQVTFSSPNLVGKVERLGWGVGHIDHGARDAVRSS